jgi:hypothetical protein
MSNEIHCVTFNNGDMRLDTVYSEDDFRVASVRFKLVSKMYGVLQESSSIPVRMLFELAALAEVSIQERTQRLENELVRMKKEMENGKED